VLAVTSEAPWPLDSGGHLRTFHLLRALSEAFDVRLVTAAPNSTAAAIDSQGISVSAAAVRKRAPMVELAAAAAAFVGRPTCDA